MAPLSIVFVNWKLFRRNTKFPKPLINRYLEYNPDVQQKAKKKKTNKSV